MNKLFKDIRHSDVDAVRAAISKNIAVVNEVYTAKAPKKDIGQSPLQVAIKCGEFEIIELLLENGADPDFMENPELVPPHSVCMSVLHDAIIGVFSSLCYEQYISSEKYVNLIEVLLKKELILIEKHHQKYCQSVRLYTKQRAFCVTRVLTQIFKK